MVQQTIVQQDGNNVIFSPLSHLLFILCWLLTFLQVDRRALIYLETIWYSLDEIVSKYLLLLELGKPRYLQLVVSVVVSQTSFYLFSKWLTMRLLQHSNILINQHIQKLLKFQMTEKFSSETTNVLAWKLPLVLYRCSEEFFWNFSYGNI